MSDRNSTCSSVRPAGTLIGPTSANGTRAYSACPPAIAAEHVRVAEQRRGEWPHSFSAIHAFGFEFSQQREQLLATREALAARDRERHDDAVADLQVLHVAPTSTTSPMNSWPRMSPFSIVGMKPL